MKVIFTTYIKNVAAKGDVKNVKDGYYRNYLQPNNFALPATEKMLEQWAEKKKQMVVEKEQLKNQLEEVKRRISGGGVKIEKKVTKKKTLYGGVKEKDVRDAIKEALSIELPEGSITVPDHIKAIGTYEITVDFGEGVTSKLPIEIVEKK